MMCIHGHPGRRLFILTLPDVHAGKTCEESGGIQGVPPHYFNFCTNNDQEGGTPGITAFNTV